MPSLSNILQLATKELRSLALDPAIVLLILYAFSLSIHTSATAVPESPHRATVGVVNEDASTLSWRLIDALQMPYFLPPESITREQMDTGMDSGRFTFTLVFLSVFQVVLL